jgi:3-hydroxybutyryl-CoA dehydrogenase
VQLYDRSPEQISKGLNLMDRLLAKDISKGKIQEADARHARERVSVIDQVVGVRALRDVDMVIEVRRQNRPSRFSSLNVNIQGCIGKS